MHATQAVGHRIVHLEGNAWHPWENRWRGVRRTGSSGSAVFTVV